MTQHIAFEEGSRLRAADLNGESESHTADAARHVRLAHPGPATGPRLAGNSVIHPAGSPSVAAIPDGPGAGVRVMIGDATPELELGTEGGHRAARSVSAAGVDVVAREALRVRSQPPPTPAAPAPWSIRAVDVLDEDARLTARELRVELSAPPGFPAQESRVAIGTLESWGFESKLMVDAAGTVTVTGDLAVAGSVSQGEIEPDLEDPRFVALLADLVARRVVGAAATAPDTAIGLVVAINAAGSNSGQTVLDASFTPSTTALSRWGAAWESLRGGVSDFRLVGVGGPVAAGVKVSLTTPPVPWDPPLSASSPGRVVFVVAAFDAQGTLRAQRQEFPGLTG